MNNLINFCRRNVSQITKLFSNDGESLENKNDIACKLANEFIVSKSECDITIHRDKVKLYESEFLCNNPDYKQSKVHKEEVEGAILYVKKGGSDKNTIPRQLVKKFCYTLSIPLAMLFNLIFTLSCIPLQFKNTICTPLYKGKGSHFDSSSYRAIYGLSFVTKVFERVLFIRLQKMVQKKLSNFQHGFRSNRSCERATAFLTQSLLNIIDKRVGKV